MALRRKQLAALITGMLLPGLGQAGAFFFAGDGSETSFTHPVGYSSGSTSVVIRVCPVDTGMGPALAEWEQSLRNIIATYNAMQPTTGNLRDSNNAGALDFESVALHELGHCIGKAHPNIANESGLSSAVYNYTKSTRGTNGSFNLNDGADNIIGSADDIRSDDANLHWFRIANNDPFTMDYDAVDTSTYSVALGDLPAGDNFAANADRDVGAASGTSYTEAVMQQGTFSGEYQRSLTPDDVATLLLARSGPDRIAGTSDDYDVTLEYATSACDIEVRFDITSSGLAYCTSSGAGSGGDVVMSTPSMHFNIGNFYDWNFSTAAPCQKTTSLVQNQWTLVALPCQVGISSGDTVAEILGDDLAGTYGTNWGVFERDAATDSYRQLATSDTMETGRGYWVITTLAGQSFDVSGEYPASPDIPLQGDLASGRWNLVGNPYDFPIDWVNTQLVADADLVVIGSSNETSQISHTFHVWNGTEYVASDGVTAGMDGGIDEGTAFWVKVFGDGLRLRMPAIPETTLTSPTITLLDTSVADEVTVTWNAVPDARYYHVSRWDYDSGFCYPGGVQGVVEAGTTTFTDTDFSSPSASGSYCYSVEACWTADGNPVANGCSNYAFYLATPIISGAEVVAGAPAATAEPAPGLQETMEARKSAAPTRIKPPKIDGGKVRDDGAWFLRVVATAGDKESRNAVLGELPDALEGRDPHDLEKKIPFGASFLTVMFPHPDWGGEEWGFASDFRDLKRQPQGEWTFAVYASSDVGEITLDLEGPDSVLKKARLWRGAAAGKADASRGESYRFHAEPGLNIFTLRVGGK